MSNLIRKAKKGFTLIELMIVVAIIGILAAIAIPNFLRFQLKSKSSEGKVNIAAIRTAEESYIAEFGNYVAALTPEPATVPGTSKAQFDATNVDFNTLGWAPEGQVFFQYAVNYVSATPSMYTVTAAADIDGNGTNQVWGYVKASTDAVPVGLIGVHTECAATGIVGNQLSTVGPCAANFGQSEF